MDKTKDQVRLDRLLANSGYGSRSDVKVLVRSGAVTVNGVPAEHADMHVRLSCDKVVVDGQPLDVLVHVYYMMNKPAACVAICRRGGATAAFQTMNMMFEMVNMPLITSQYWNIAYGREPGEATQDAEGMQTMRVLADNMAWLLKKIHAGDNPDYPEREEWQPTHFIR